MSEHSPGSESLLLLLLLFASLWPLLSLMSLSFLSLSLLSSSVVETLPGAAAVVVCKSFSIISSSDVSTSVAAGCNGSPGGAGAAAAVGDGTGCSSAPGAASADPTAVGGGWSSADAAADAAGDADGDDPTAVGGGGSSAGTAVGGCSTGCSFAGADSSPSGVGICGCNGCSSAGADPTGFGGGGSSAEAGATAVWCTWSFAGAGVVSSSWLESIIKVSFGSKLLFCAAAVFDSSNSCLTSGSGIACVAVAS